MSEQMNQSVFIKENFIRPMFNEEFAEELKNYV